MTLNQALAIINSRKGKGGKKVHYLACGFEPLHLATLLRASLLERLPDDDVELLTGVYGDLSGNLTLAAESPATAAAVAIEWSDIDPRLGLRASGGWSDEAKSDILDSARQRCSHLHGAIEKLGVRMPVAVAGPSLPLPPFGNTVGAQASIVELELEHQLAYLMLGIARLPGVRVVRPPRFALDERMDVRMELLAGFPYTVPFAAVLADSMAGVLHQPVPKKGLITDLDDTLWSGIVGEVGAEGVSWHQEHHTQIHGLYQQMLGHLAGCGVLVAVCSKNEISTVEAALARKDLLVGSDALFPVIAHWGPKSSSVSQILRAWNIAEDAVVFVDDSPMELDEVRRAFPGITCLQFPGKHPDKVWSLLGQLRDLFGKPLVMDEDRLRQASLRASAQLQGMGDAAGSPEFLRSLQGTVTFSWRRDPADKRPLELINKTNQFNLNGLRIGEGEWQRDLEDPARIVAVVSYQDKFGPLGKIAVLAGLRSGAKVRVSNWVMSCRAFSRRIEHHTLDALFRHSGAEEIEFAFQPTERNQPLQEFFRATGICTEISRENFLSRCGILPHQVLDLTA